MNIDEMITKLRQAHQAGESITVKDGGAVCERRSEC